MKILTSQQIREIDAKTISSENISSLQLMKRAATAFFNWFTIKYPDKKLSILIIAGIGNNGGDALMVARLLHKAGYKVNVYIVKYGERYTKDCAHNIERIKAENISYQMIISDEDIPDMASFDVLVDGLFGTGLSREITGIAAEMIQKINQSPGTIVSIDVPSGLFLHRETTLAIMATETITFQIPKLALFLPANHKFAGNVFIVDIGLSERAISQAETNTYFIEKKDIKILIRSLAKFAHKGTQGHALIIGGSLGKIGSVCLSSKAALKTGCGLVTAFLPKCGTMVLQTNFPEAMAIEDHNEKYITDIVFDIAPDAIGIGIGLAQMPETQDAFHRFLQTNKLPLVVDADGLNILSQHPEWLTLLPPKTILTPHPKEFSRLIGGWIDDYEKIEKLRSFAKKYNIIVILKGAYSLIVDSENLFVNSSGSPALATAGSGDVLTGIITSLLAQKYEPMQAALIGVYLHGLTADITYNSIHPHSFIASDIIENIGSAYFELEE